MKRIGITGSIGAGKSTVGRLLRERGFAVLDCDAEVHRLYACDKALRQSLAKAFGKSVLTLEGVSREYLADIVFKDSAKREKLESIVYPHLENSIDDFFAIASSAGDACAFVEAALLFKVPLTLLSLDVVWNVDAAQDVRLERLVRRGLLRDDAKRRVVLQLHNPPLDHPFVKTVDNSRTEMELAATIKRLLDEI